MQNQFIVTKNVTDFNSICEEMEDVMSLIGPSMAMITGPAGRGKTEAAKVYAASSSAVYVPPMNKTSATMLLRAICFDLCATKPGRIEGCLDVISEEMKINRRVIIIDEADLLPMPILEMLRNVNERYACPVLLIGEDDLKRKIMSRRRLNSRMRRRIEFAPVTQADVSLFFKKALDIKISPDVASLIHKYSKGDWRPVLTAAIDMERAMQASGLNDLPVEMVKGILHE